MKRVFSLFATAFALLAVGCAQRTDLEAERTALLNTDKEWAAAASVGKDVGKIVSYWADDAVIIPSGGPIIEGKEAIQQYVTQSLQIPGFSINWETEKVFLSAGGDLAYAMGRNTFTFSDEDGKHITSIGRGVTVWRKDANGAWKCVVDIWNEEPPPPTADTASGG